MSFFSELKRRNVFRVGAAYLVVAWLLIQVVDTLGDLFEWPNTLGQVVVIILVIGFPVALIVSWIYEVTPTGITTQDAVDAGAKTTSGNKLNAVIIGGLVLVIAMLLVDDMLLVEDMATPDVSAQQAGAGVSGASATDNEIVETGFNEENSIAVLPFTNLSNDPDQEYFSDGLTEELIAKLSSVDGLLVTGRTSVFYFKGSMDSPQQIADSLGVNHILQGSVRKAGNQLRITTTLMNTDNGFNLWTETYNRELADIFAIQDEIAEEVTQALSFTLGAGEFDRPGMTRNIQAYDAWLQYLSIPFSSDANISQARNDALQRAVALDP